MKFTTGLVLAAATLSIATLQAQMGCTTELTPLKPMPPLGCSDMLRTCLCDPNGTNCYWTWLCQPARSGSVSASSPPTQQPVQPTRSIEEIIANGPRVQPTDPTLSQQRALQNRIYQLEIQRRQLELESNPAYRTEMQRRWQVAQDKRLEKQQRNLDKLAKKADGGFPLDREIATHQ